MVGGRTLEVQAPDNTSVRSAIEAFRPRYRQTEISEPALLIVLDEHSAVVSIDRRAQPNQAGNPTLLDLDHSEHCACGGGLMRALVLGESTKRRIAQHARFLT